MQVVKNQVVSDDEKIASSPLGLVYSVINEKEWKKEKQVPLV